MVGLGGLQATAKRTGACWRLCKENQRRKCQPAGHKILWAKSWFFFVLPGWQICQSFEWRHQCPASNQWQTKRPTQKTFTFKALALPWGSLIWCTLGGLWRCHTQTLLAVSESKIVLKNRAELTGISSRQVIDEVFAKHQVQSHSRRFGPRA